MQPLFGAEGVRPASGCFRREERMRLHRREKVFGPGWAIPLDRNQKARIAAYARAWSARNRQGAHHPRLPGRPAGAAVGLPQQPLRGLLPELRRDCRQGGVRALDGSRGAQGTGVGGCADLAAQASPRAGALPGPMGPGRMALARHPHVKRLRLPRSAGREFLRCSFQVRKSGRNTKPRCS